MWETEATLLDVSTKPAQASVAARKHGGSAMWYGKTWEEPLYDE